MQTKSPSINDITTTLPRFKPDAVRLLFTMLPLELMPADSSSPAAEAALPPLEPP